MRPAENQVSFQPKTCAKLLQKASLDYQEIAPSNEATLEQMNILKEMGLVEIAQWFKDRPRARLTGTGHELTRRRPGKKALAAKLRHIYADFTA